MFDHRSHDGVGVDGVHGGGGNGRLMGCHEGGGNGGHGWSWYGGQVGHDANIVVRPVAVGCG